MLHNTDNVRIISSAPMVSPNTLIEKLPLSEKAASVVVSARNTIKNVLYGNDNRLMVLVGRVQFMIPRLQWNMLKIFQS